MRKVVETVNINIGSEIIVSKPVIKYLGVMLDKRLCFETSRKYAVHRAWKVYAVLSCLNTKKYSFA